MCVYFRNEANKQTFPLTDMIRKVISHREVPLSVGDEATLSLRRPSPVYSSTVKLHHPVNQRFHRFIDLRCSFSRFLNCMLYKSNAHPFARLFEHKRTVLEK